ncbi:unnamed protein product [Callosobruchus maculatus]|uniref:Uncharacterized protein n=1 Tax=Callosobruchus maculatus TaxID=64391 RepID=A0A653C865_CALMS|nr:unnamed protein product [Callosobruchus maculatus]
MAESQDWRIAEESHKYLVVEFPEEEGDDGLPVAVISSNWLCDDNDVPACYWPSYLKSTSQREKALLQHQQIREESCMKCPIIIKFSTGIFLLN